MGISFRKVACTKYDVPWLAEQIDSKSYHYSLNPVVSKFELRVSSEGDVLLRLPLTQYERIAQLVRAYYNHVTTRIYHVLEHLSTCYRRRNRTEF